MDDCEFIKQKIFELVHIVDELEQLHSDREAYSVEMGYVQGWKDAEKYLR